MKVSHRLAALVVRWPRLVLLVTLGLTLASILPILRFHIETDISSILPDGAPGAEDYRVFLKTFGGFEKVFVIVRSPGKKLEDAGPLIAAAEALAQKMGGSAEIAEARSGLTEADERFFFRYIAPRMPLLVGDDWRAQIEPRLTPAAIRARVAFMRQTMRSPAGKAMAPLFTADPLGLSEGLIGSAASSLPLDPLTGAFLSPQGDAALVIITPARAELDPAAGRALLHDLEKAYAAVRRESDIPLDFQAVGGPIYAAQDEALLRVDLRRMAIASALGVAVLLLLGFGGAFIPMVILISVLVGTVWSIAAASLWLGTVSVVGMGFTVALVGVGVEYGIHAGARYRQLRVEGWEPGPALVDTFRDPGPGIFSSALTTAAGLGALCLAHFRPLREMGQLLTVGVLVTLLTTMTMGAALLLLFPRRVQVSAPPKPWMRFGFPLLRGMVNVSARLPRTVLVAVALLTAVSVWGLFRLDLSTDLRSLRPADAPTNQAEKLLVEKFALGLDTLTVVTRGKTLDQALDEAAAVKPILAARLGKAAQITTPSDWLLLGARRDRRLRELRGLPLERAADDFARELAAAGFKVDNFGPSLEILRGLGRGEDKGAPPPADWPRWMSELVRASGPNAPAAAVHVRVDLGRGQKMSSEALARDLKKIDPNIALASAARVGGELGGLAVNDLQRSSLLAFLLVTVIVVVSVGGRIGDSILAFIPLILGCVWTFGLWGVFGGRIDLLAISTLPVLFGTGIDLGVHAVHGGRVRPEEGIRGTVLESGLAMLLITLTTGVGFGSLGGSRVPGLQSAGTMVAVGVVACLLATFVVLPALEALGGRRTIEASHAKRAEPPSPS
jgi:predicted RND superfamily exporter protein